LASGAVSPLAALVLATALGVAGVAFAVDNPTLLLLLAPYVALNLAYSWRLKHVPVVDVFIIASGFMLRLLAGTAAVGIPPSRWLLLTGLFIALFLGFSKRKAETFHTPEQQRAVLEHYPSALLDVLMAVTMTATITMYSLYATSAEALAMHGERLVYTVPVVIFGLLRYAYQVHRGRGEDVARDLLRDPWILLTGALWLALFLGSLL
jgi:4-hydroxybenzoate polyprenyltransferase